MVVVRKRKLLGFVVEDEYNPFFYKCQQYIFCWVNTGHCLRGVVGIRCDSFKLFLKTDGFFFFFSVIASEVWGVRLDGLEVLSEVSCQVKKIAGFCYRGQMLVLFLLSVNKICFVNEFWTVWEVLLAFGCGRLKLFLKTGLISFFSIIASQTEASNSCNLSLLVCQFVDVGP